MPSVSSKSTQSRGHLKNNSSNRELIQKMSSQYNLDNSPTENTNLLKKENLKELNENAKRHIDLLRERSKNLGKGILKKTLNKTQKLRKQVSDNRKNTNDTNDINIPYPNGGKRKKRVSYRRRRPKI